MNLANLNHGQVTRTTPELSTYYCASTPHEWENIGASTYLTCIDPSAQWAFCSIWTQTRDTPTTNPKPLPLGYYSQKAIFIGGVVFSK
ncbi:hypothetical protein TNCV_1060601 [Trichonephila clavipes]|nr:hypothetical protein TNCV_1060601 [Trichonephila clavipes]